MGTVRSSGDEWSDDQRRRTSTLRRYTISDLRQPGDSDNDAIDRLPANSVLVFGSDPVTLTRPIQFRPGVVFMGADLTEENHG